MANLLHSSTEDFSFSALPWCRAAPPLLCTGLALRGSFRILQEACDGLGRTNSRPQIRVRPLIQPVELLCPRAIVLLVAGGWKLAALLCTDLYAPALW